MELIHRLLNAPEQHIFYLGYVAQANPPGYNNNLITHSGYLFYGSKHFFAIEVKNSSRVRPEDLIPLKSFVTDFSECTPILLYRGKERIKIEGILCIPVDQYLMQIIPGNPLPQ